jgi:long-chain fatty acid transport protein
MKKTISVLALASVFAAGSAFASAYRIPEQSVDSTSKAGANISSANHADAAYFNPANMSWLDNAWQIEGDFSYIHLSSISYKGAATLPYNGSTKEENFLAPAIFVVSPDFNSFRFGFSMTAPYGLAKRWDGAYPETFADKFELQVFEINPTVSYKINKIVSVAAGVRMLPSSATLATYGRALGQNSLFMQGDTTSWGYNLAISARPDSNSNISVTYRSNVDMNFGGPANFYFYPSGSASGHGDVTVPAPAVLAVSGAYTFWDKLTVELTWDRTFWSAYKNLDITIPSLNTEIITPKDWNDSSAYRIGLTYKATQVTTLMAGFAYDETPVPSKNLGFELPDSNAYLFSLGARFKVNSQMDLGLGLLYDLKTDRTVNNLATGGHANGKFTDASALLVTAGMNYTF